LEINKSLELIITVNGLFLAILMTYFLREYIIWSLKKENHKDAIIHSQKNNRL